MAAEFDPKVVRAVLGAAKKGDLSALRTAINATPALLGVRDKDGSTPLHCAAWKGHDEVVTYLLEVGADVNDHNQNEHWGTSPLHAAAHGNQKKVAEVLLAHGADVAAKNMHNRTPLQETEVHNARAVAKLLGD
jgi:ankyrin repeat protein